MTTSTAPHAFELDRSDPMELLTHMVAYGLAAIVEAATDTPPALSWTEGMAPHARLAHEALTPTDMAGIVRSHATHLGQEAAWPQERLELAGRPRGLMSPRLARIDDWAELTQRRHEVLDRLTGPDTWLDQLFLWSLGEPCYWSFGPRDEIRQDDAASRLELQPRNQGSEIVGNRLSPLVEAVAGRTPEEIEAGLVGVACRDSVGHDAPDSRSGIGFRAPGPVDDAVSWCAIWGLSQFALNRSPRRTTTAGNLRDGRSEWSVVPIWRGEWTPARLRSVLASAQLRAVAEESTGQEADEPADAFATSDGRRWLLARGVKALVAFPVQRFGSASAPERRAQRGVVYSIERHPR
jgi:CRISPR-associated protein Csb3